MLGRIAESAYMGQKSGFGTLQTLMFTSLKIRIGANSGRLTRRLSMSVFENTANIECELNLFAMLLN